ncbi:MAG TPA: hypothetical protein HPP56_01355 [Nitrospirae bacterium]|nr:hypothetical protein [Nitrospirota bacterium]
MKVTTLRVTKTYNGYLNGPFNISISNKSNLPIKLLIKSKGYDNHIKIIYDRFYINPDSQMIVMINLLIQIMITTLLN